jgi:two-component system NtrC family sensor kinase
VEAFFQGLEAIIMNKPTTLEDIIGLEYTKLGFFGEVKKNMARLETTNRELERKQQKLEAIFDGISDVMAIISEDLTIVSVNQIYHTFFKHANPRGHFCYEIFKKRDCPCLDCPIAESQETNKVCRKTMSFDIEDKHYQFDITVSPLRNAKKHASRFLVLMRDVTREKEYQSKYNHSKKMATVGALAAGVAHEINNPLTSISGFTKGLQRRLPILDKTLPDTEESHALMADFTEYIDTILNECDRCRDIVQGLLTFSPRKKVDFTPLNLKRIVTGVLRLLYHRLKETPQVTITLNARKNLPHIMGNAAELKQVILNLVCNALDAVNGKGSLQLDLSQKKDQIRFSIKDDGYGIDLENMDQLFDPFFTTKPIGQGIGIGLSTCYNIIQQHHGEVLVKSKKNQGTTFTVVLPLPHGETP